MEVVTWVGEGSPSLLSSHPLSPGILRARWKGLFPGPEQKVRGRRRVMLGVLAMCGSVWGCSSALEALLVSPGQPES